MNKTKPLQEPNYNILFDSSVTAYQIAYMDYKKAVNDYLKNTFIDNDGNFCILEGYEQRVKRINDIVENINRIKIDVEYYRQVQSRRER